MGAAYHRLTHDDKPAHDWLTALWKAGKGTHSNKELASDAVALAILVGVELSQGLSFPWERIDAKPLILLPTLSTAMIHVVDTFLDDKFLPQITALVKADKFPADKTLKGYIAEVLRLRPPVPGVIRTLGADFEDKKAGDRVYLAYNAAGIDVRVLSSLAKRPTKPRLLFYLARNIQSERHRVRPFAA